MAGAKSERDSAARPLSPHLQIYTFEVNMVMSIVHRVTGGALYFGILIVAAVLIAAAAGRDAYTYVTGLLATWPGQIILFGYTWALFHHLFGGLRHFIWDTGAGFDLKTIDRLSWATLALSLLATAIVWVLVLARLGGLSA